jgi:disulfide bond formation protein DsbB
MLSLQNRRLLNVAGFLVCAAMMGFALYAQYVLMLMPCPLCVLQRVAVIGLGFVFLLAAVHHPDGAGKKIYSFFLGIVGLSGAGVAAWHVRMQNLPADEIPSCGPGLGYMLDNFPLGDAMRMVFEGSGECAEVMWRFLGLTMPTWVLVGVGGLTIAGIWNNLRKPA